MKHLRYERDISIPTEADDGSTFGTGNKRVVMAVLTLVECQPDPTKRIVSVVTEDGWTYRFQRFDDDEPLVPLHRVRPDGEQVGRGRVPQAVDKFTTAIENERFETGRHDVPHPWGDSTTEQAIADGGQPVEDDQDDQDDTRECRKCDRVVRKSQLESGFLCPVCADRRRQKEHRREQSLSAHPTIDDPTPRHDYRDQQP